ncbi:hypothetical protein ABE504_20825 [Paenibacillus oryzisoli]|uniref:hypothetical protein n=1 Tax=Paenibacillus oryzisoli TaxID=1850517 RepID=UPI003D29A0F4
MNERVFIEENGQFQFDFSAALWATDQLNSQYTKISSVLSDVDFIAETDTEILLIEYKNTDVENAADPGAFVQKLREDKHYISMAMKFYGGLLYLLALKHTKPFCYIYILECATAGSTERLRIKTKIGSKLPFELQKEPEFNQQLIKRFEILSISEWNNNPAYRQFPIAAIGS